MFKNDLILKGIVYLEIKSFISSFPHQQSRFKPTIIALFCRTQKGIFKSILHGHIFQCNKCE